MPVWASIMPFSESFVTSATVVIYGKALWDPVDLASRMTGAAVLIALIVLLILDLRPSSAIPAGFVDEFTDIVNKRKFKEAFEMAQQLYITLLGIWR